MVADATLARFPAMRAGYESYYLRASAPDGGRGFWLRHTVRIAAGEEPTGSLWFTWFDAAAGITATKLTAPHPAGGEGDQWIEIAGAGLGPGRAVGAIAPATGRPAASWDLTFTGEPVLEHLPKPWMYTAPLPKTNPVSLHPVARFTGSVTIEGREVSVEGWPGMVGHNWGTQHAERWIWLHGMGFRDAGDDTWLDVVLGRIKVGPVTLPWVASGAISLDGQRHELGGLGRTRRTNVVERPDGARIVLPGRDGLEVSVMVGAPLDRFVGWTYADPDRHTHDVANCSIADLEVTVALPGASVRRLVATGTAAYELGMRERDHGVPIQPFPDA